MKTVFTYAHEKWFYGQSERAYSLNYFTIQICSLIAIFLDIRRESDRGFYKKNPDRIHNGGIREF